MNKILLTLAAIVISIVSQAAQIKWAVNTATPTGTEYANYKVYICESVTAFQTEAQISDYLLGTAGNTATMIDNRGFGMSSGTLKGISDEKSGQMQTFKVVIVDKTGTGYWVTDGSAQIFTTETTHTDFTLADASTMLAKPMTVFGTSPVPEPTSGLMLMLGVGLMALKRKRA